MPALLRRAVFSGMLSARIATTPGDYCLPMSLLKRIGSVLAGLYLLVSAASAAEKNIIVVIADDLSLIHI